MQSLRDRIHERIDNLDESILPKLDKTLDEFEQKPFDVDETMALWEQLAEPNGEDLPTLIKSLERRPLFDKRKPVFEPDA